MNPVIYIIKNLSNGKCYIGSNLGYQHSENTKTG